MLLIGRHLAILLLAAAWLGQDIAALCHSHARTADQSSPADCGCHHHAPGTPHEEVPPQEDEDCAFCRVLAERPLLVPLVLDLPPADLVYSVIPPLQSRMDWKVPLSYLSRGPPLIA